MLRFAHMRARRLSRPIIPLQHATAAVSYSRRMTFNSIFQMTIYPSTLFGARARYLFSSRRRACRISYGRGRYSLLS